MADIVELGGGRRASYEVVGDGPPMLMFVGGPGLAAGMMRFDAELLADRFAVHLIDPHGSGGSSPPADPSGYDNEGHAAFYDEVRRALGLGEVALYGQSFGGLVSLTYAAMFTDVVTRCIANGAFAMGIDVDAAEGGAAEADMERMLQRHAKADWYPEARRIWDEWTDRVLAASDAAEVDEMFVTAFPLYVADPDRPDVRAKLDQVAPLLKTDLAAAKVWENGLYQGIDLRPLLPKIQAPTLVVSGELDPICGPAQAGPIADAVPNAELVIIPGSGHIPSIEEPEALRTILTEWLDRT